ncbi:hypothetical protein C8035_v008375 [Colletotrichum spinosum]|uniref:Uncharacterized protein n=1 Tax=Colletotrichum spinosum TaxID=1347390 RepID=A0A4R8QE19_9PEZI|nr:hypothetical protein C8035_v008375 [Colletotrichum spinosum]
MEQASDSSARYKPTPVDVIVVRIMLEKATKLPPELLDLMFDQAEYWPHSESTFHRPYTNPRDCFCVIGGSSAENKLVLRCPPIGFVDYHKVGEAFKTATLPPKLADGSAAIEPMGHLTNMEHVQSPSAPTREAGREYFEGSMSQPPALIHPVRKIVFKLRSRDQGWGGAHGDRGTYRHSWTWFEAGLEKFDEDRQCDEACKVSPQSPTAESDNGSRSPTSNLCTCGLQSIHPPIVELPNGALAYHHHVHADDNLKIQCNKTATREWAEHEVVWSWEDDILPDSLDADRLEEVGRGRGTGTGRFVRNLKLGDVVTVWGKARFGGWANYVESVKVEIYWAI